MTRTHQHWNHTSVSLITMFSFLLHVLFTLLSSFCSFMHIETPSLHFQNNTMYWWLTGRPGRTYISQEKSNWLLESLEERRTQCWSSQLHRDLSESLPGSPFELPPSLVSTGMPSETANRQHGNSYFAMLEYESSLLLSIMNWSPVASDFWSLTSCLRFLFKAPHPAVHFSDLGKYLYTRLTISFPWEHSLFPFIIVVKQWLIATPHAYSIAIRSSHGSWFSTLCGWEIPPLTYRKFNPGIFNELSTQRGHTMEREM